MSTAHIESVRIKGFRSLADFALDEVPRVAVFVGANGSGKSNFIHFFEMLSWMLRSRRLADFVAFQGGADDQLFEGSKNTRYIEANVRLRTDQSEIDYWFELVRALRIGLYLQRKRFGSRRKVRQIRHPGSIWGVAILKRR